MTTSSVMSSESTSMYFAKEIIGRVAFVLLVSDDKSHWLNIFFVLLIIFFEKLGKLCSVNSLMLRFINFLIVDDLDYFKSNLYSLNSSYEIASSFPNVSYALNDLFVIWVSIPRVFE